MNATVHFSIIHRLKIWVQWVSVESLPNDIYFYTLYALSSTNNIVKQIKLNFDICSIMKTLKFRSLIYSTIIHRIYSDIQFHFIFYSVRNVL